MGLFVLHPGKAAWCERSSQASNFGRLGQLLAWEAMKQTAPICNKMQAIKHDLAQCKMFYGIN